MKKNIILSVILLVSGQILSQTDSISAPKDIFYAGFGLNYPLGMEVTAGRFGQHGWGASFCINAFTRPAMNAPSNFDGGSTLFGAEHGKQLHDIMSTVSFHVMKLFALKSKKSYFGLEAGPSFVNTSIPKDFKPVIDPCGINFFTGKKWCDPNYTYNKNAYVTFGFSAKLSLKTMSNRFSGNEIGLETHLNSQWPYYGASAMILLGRLK